MTQRISILRIVGLIAAVTLLTGTVTSVIEYRRMDRKFWEWVNARPMSAPVDLSQPGVFTAPFHQTRHGGHGEAFYLNVDPMPRSDYEELLKDLDGSITIQDSAGKEVESLAISSSTDIRNPSDARGITAFAGRRIHGHHPCQTRCSRVTRHRTAHPCAA